jgi:hypothetical protein
MVTDNENWIVEAGDAVVRSRVDLGPANVKSLDLLIYCLWVADYGMRNAGDLDTAGDLYAPFHDEGLRTSKELGLTETHSFFALSLKDLEQQYFERFDIVCNEIRSAQRAGQLRG